MPKNATQVTGSRKLSSEEYRVLAEHAEDQETYQRKRNRKTRVKRAAGVPEKKWATPTNTKVAEKQDAAHRREQAKQRKMDRPDRDQLWEKQRQAMIRDRNRRRRLPWYPPLVSVAVGLVGYGAVALCEATTSVPATVPAAVFAAAPTMGTLAFCVSREHRFHQRVKLSEYGNHDPVAPTHRRWAPEVFAGGAGCAGLTYWIALAGLSWPVVLVLLLGTLVCGWRWWKTNPIGPGVPPLEPPRPTKPAPEPAAEPAEHDPYALAWQHNNASRDGKATGSKLTNGRTGEFTYNYDIELKRGAQTVDDLHATRAPLASGLGEEVENVLFKKHPHRKGAHLAQLTIIHTDPVAQPRFFTAPHVEDGVIKSVARFVDGSGDVDVTMWDDNGTVPTMVAGSLGGGKSGCANVLTASALSTGLLNLLYADPKGNSSTALASRARVAVIGKDNVLKLPYLLHALLKARGDLASTMDADQLFPTPDVPGWMLLHDEYSLIANDPLAATTWTETVNTVRALGMWPVALNQSLGMPQWGNDHARSAFASQVIAFRINSKSGSDLVPGMVFDPNELPYTVNEQGRFRAVPGMAVHAYVETPVRWDFLPSESNAARMAEKNEEQPPHTTESAFDSFFHQPELHPRDQTALEALFGPPVNGRWQIGGKHATHKFPNLNKTAANQPPRGKWGQRTAEASGHSANSRKSPVDGLTESQRRVYQVIEGGTTKAADIEAALDTLGRSTIHAALSDLVGMNLIHRPEGRRGEYAIADGPSEQANGH